MLKKSLSVLLLVLCSLVVLALLVWMAAAGPVTVVRILRFGVPQIDDYKYFPSRSLAASDTPQPFGENKDDFRVPVQIELPGERPRDLDELLAENDTLAFLVVKNDVLVYESYYQGHSPEKQELIFSVSKSFTATLIGAAIQDGYIESVEQPLTDFIPELADQGFADVCLRDLLTMTSGSDYVNDTSRFSLHATANYTPNLRRVLLGLTASLPPGEEFRYKAGDTALLGLVLDRALAPKTITDYAQEKLWEPLGMEDDGEWSLDRAGDGLEKVWGYLAASPRDLAKLGRLYLNDGNWNGEQFLPPDWVAEATQQTQIPWERWPASYTDLGIYNYGYQWWLLAHNRRDFLAWGRDGQFIYIYPSKQIIIVRVGRSDGDLQVNDWIDLFQIVANETE